MGKLAHHPYRMGGLRSIRAWQQGQTWPTSGRIGTSPLPYVGSLTLQSVETKNQMWPTSRRIGHIMPTIWGIRDAGEHGNKIKSGPQGGRLTTSPLPYGGFPAL